MKETINFFWFRRDLRIHDNTALYHALRSGKPVHAIFIFDSDILDKLDDKLDRRLVFIHQQLEALNKELEKHGSSLMIIRGKPFEAWKKLLNV